MPIVEYPDFQYPDLPVELTVGAKYVQKLGRQADFDPKNWGGTLVWGTALQGVGNGRNGIYNQGEQAGDQLVLCLEYTATDYYGSPSFVSEKNMTRIFYNYTENATGQNFAYMFVLYRVNSALDNNTNLNVELGPSTAHNFGLSVIRNFSEYQ